MNLANQMGTDANHGTTVNGMLNGLEGYLESEDGVDGSANWNTYLLQSSVVGAVPFWSTLQGELSLGKGILLAIGWKSGCRAGTTRQRIQIIRMTRIRRTPWATR